MTARRTDRAIRAAARDAVALALAGTPAPAPTPIRPPQGRAVLPPRMSSLAGRSLQAATPGLVSSSLGALDRGVYEQWADIATQMMRDPVVRRAYHTRRFAVAGRPYIVAAPDDVDPRMKADAEALADITREWLASVDAPETFLMRVLDGIGVGISMHELVWSRVRGTYMPQPVPVLTRNIRYTQEWQTEVRNADFEWLSTSDKPAKFLTHIPWTTPGRPMDQGDLLAVVWYWMFKRNAWVFWLTGAERFGNPLVLGKMAEASTLRQRQDMLEDLQQMTADSVAVTAGDSDITIIPPAASGSTAVWKELRQALNEEIALALGVSMDAYVSGPNGSRSSSETRDGVRLEGTKGDAALMWGSIVRDVVPWLSYYNLRRNDVPLPIISTVFEDQVAIPRDLIDAGAVRINELRESVGLSPLSDEDGGNRIASIAQAPPAPFSQAQPPTSGGTSPASPFRTSPPSADGMPMLSSVSTSTSPTLYDSATPRLFARVPPSGGHTS